MAALDQDKADLAIVTPVGKSGGNVHGKGMAMFPLRSSDWAKQHV